MKHNKKRNTAFIYETLSRELTKAIIDHNVNKKQNVTSIIKEYFTKGNILAQQLQLYTVVLKTRNIKESLAERILQEAKIAHARLNSKEIFEAQSTIISKINKTIGQQAWSNFVPNFKSLASIDAIFNIKTGMKKRVLFEQSIVDNMSAKHEAISTNTLEPIDNITYNSFIKKFNDKYGVLLQEQKDLLNQFITSFGDDGFELRVYLNEELARLKALVAEASSSTEEPLIEEKLKGVADYLNEFKKREFTDADLSKVLVTQELVQELVSK